MLASHHPVICRSLREIIEQEADLEVVAETRDLEEALMAARTLEPEVVVMEISLARDKGVEALLRVRRSLGSLRIVMVGISADREHVMHAMKAGACGYLRTEDAAEELVAAIRTACFRRPFLGAAVEREEIMAEIASSRARPRILVVEDDEDFVEILKATLESAEYEVLIARDKEDGLRLARSERPDAVILDVMMPAGTEGFHFVWELRQDPDEQVKETPILVLTAIHQHTGLRLYPDQSDGTYGPQEFLPVQDFIDKPVEPAQLLDKVRRALESPGQWAAR
jgi:DNA-binding NarL/FixJ family response regulator